MQIHRFELLTNSYHPDNEHPDWRRLDLLHISLLEQAAERTGKEPFLVRGKGCRVRIDFAPYVERIRRHHEIGKRIYDEHDHSAFDEFDHSTVRVPIEVSGLEISEHGAASLVELLFYELFLSMNLAAPGSLNLVSAHISSCPPKYRANGTEIISDLGLHSKIFEDASLDADTFPWLKVGLLDFDAVCEWLLRVAPRGQMIPHNPASKCLFSLFYLARSDFSPATAVWVFNALEALMSCKPGENFGQLVRRISALLDLAPNESATLKRRLRQAYDLRSSFVHGGMKVVHPMRDDGFDESVNEEYWSKAFQPTFGAMVIVACLQALIRNQWDFLSFEEKMSGQRI